MLLIFIFELFVFSKNFEFIAHNLLSTSCTIDAKNNIFLLFFIEFVAKGL